MTYSTNFQETLSEIRSVLEAKNKLLGDLRDVPNQAGILVAEYVKWDRQASFGLPPYGEFVWSDKARVFVDQFLQQADSVGLAYFASKFLSDAVKDRQATAENIDAFYKKLLPLPQINKALLKKLTSYLGNLSQETMGNNAKFVMEHKDLDQDTLKLLAHRVAQNLVVGAKSISWSILVHPKFSASEDLGLTRGLLRRAIGGGPVSG